MIWVRVVHLVTCCCFSRMRDAPTYVRCRGSGSNHFVQKLNSFIFTAIIPPVVVLAQDAESLKAALSLHLAHEESPKQQQQQQPESETKSEAGDGGSAVPSPTSQHKKRGIMSQGSAFITDTSASAGVKGLALAFCLLAKQISTLYSLLCERDLLLRSIGGYPSS